MDHFSSCFQVVDLLFATICKTPSVATRGLRRQMQLCQAKKSVTDALGRRPRSCVQSKYQKRFQNLAKYDAPFKPNCTLS